MLVPGRTQSLVPQCYEGLRAAEGGFLNFHQRPLDVSCSQHAYYSHTWHQLSMAKLMRKMQTYTVGFFFGFKLEEFSTVIPLNSFKLQRRNWGPRCIWQLLQSPTAP